MKFYKPLWLYPQVQNYAWGKFGADSLVAKLAGGQIHEMPYAELWFGAHPLAPSSVVVDGDKVSLDQLIREHPYELVGEKILNTYGAVLPYLFKFLSVRTALSIQLHPSKKQAEELHKLDPINYPDSNHKPELALAITPVTLLFGLKSSSELVATFLAVPELKYLFGEFSRTDSVIEGEHQEQILSRLFCLPQSELMPFCELLNARLLKERNLTEADIWFLRLYREYPKGDIGLLCIYLFNLLSLRPGEALFIPSGVPHCYLSGDIAECMASSDNVVRAGFTDKFKDSNQLLSLMDMNSQWPQVKLGQSIQDNAKIYAEPGCREFTLTKLNPGAGYKTAENTPQILVNLGVRTEVLLQDLHFNLKQGEALFLPALSAQATVLLKDPASVAFLIAPNLDSPCPCSCLLET